MSGGRLLVVGGGYIGLEVAATARELGMEVTVLEMAERLMSRVTCPEVSAFYEAEHARRGVRIRCNERVRALHGDARSGRVKASSPRQATSTRRTSCSSGSAWPRRTSSPGPRASTARTGS